MNDVIDTMKWYVITFTCLLSWRPIQMSVGIPGTRLFTRSYTNTFSSQLYMAKKAIKRCRQILQTVKYGISAFFVPCPTNISKIFVPVDGGKLGWFVSIGKLCTVQICFSPGPVQREKTVAVAFKFSPEKWTCNGLVQVW